MGRQWSCTSLWRWNPPDPARMGGAIWLYKRPFRHRILRFLFLQRRRLRLHWPRSLLAVDTPRSWTQRPRSARLIRFFAPQHRSSCGPVRCRHSVNLTHTPKRANRRYSTAARAGPPCTPMTVTASAFPAWGIPCRCRARWLWLFSLREHQSRLSALADLFLFRERPRPSRPPVFFLPGTLWGKKQRGRWSQRSRQLRSSVPRSHHTERFLPSFFPNLTSVPLQAREIWSRSGEVTKSWPMTACHWQLQMLRSCRAR